MKNLTWTIFKKECARFFGDRTLLFTSVLMPGLLIYVIYTFMGQGLAKMESGSGEVTQCYVENLPASMVQALQSLPNTSVVTLGFNGDTLKAKLASKDANLLYVVFPYDFDSLVSVYDATQGQPAPNVEIYYNSVDKTSFTVYTALTQMLDMYESSMINKFDVNRADSEEVVYNMASEDDELGTLLGSLFPMLLVMLIFSGCMAVAPSAIAGEKERGTIATLLVTPMKRNHLALGKILSLSLFALLSGVSSFLGLVLSLPKLLQVDSVDFDMSSIYSMGDYALLLLIILSTTLILVSVVGILSALAKDVKQAGTMVTPLMLMVMFCGLLPMLQGDVHVATAMYLVPFYNSIQCMASVFAFEPEPMAMVITIVANVCYTGLSVWVITKLFNSEKVMFGK